MEDHREQINSVLLFSLGITLVCGQLCKNCWNGCAEETGLCSGDCVDGWDGPTCSRRGGRLNGFTVSVGNFSSQNYKGCYHDTNTVPEGPGKIIDGVCNRGPVLGTPMCPGTYGVVCDKRCGNCAQGPSVCNTISGHCPQRIPRCMPGYTSVKCDTECIPGIYGADCVDRCGYCADNHFACDAVSGNCRNTTPRCMPGYSGPRCDTPCYGTYGADCAERCGHCAEETTPCDPTIGNCSERTPRCMPGYTGVKCNTECTSGTYGPDCLASCGFCAERNAACNTTSGHCPDREPRCALGYSGLTCDTVSGLPDYTGVIIGCSVGTSLILIIGVVFLVVVMRNGRNTHTGGALSCGPNSAPSQESCFSSEAAAVDRSKTPVPSSLYGRREGHPQEDNTYEAINQ